jgi:hypothetical protein
LNIVFELGDVMVTWNPTALSANVFADPRVQALVHREILGHADWVALYCGTLPRQEAIRRAAA